MAGIVKFKTEPQLEKPTIAVPQPVWPIDSVLNDCVEFARKSTESEDSIIIGSAIPVLAALMARRIYVQFGDKKYPNVYNVCTTPPGQGKSTTIRIFEKLVQSLLPTTSFSAGSTSDQALFKTYQANPDKILIEDEGNTVLANWASDAAGKQTAKRYLKLYDCAGWTQNYMRHAEQEGTELQIIPETSTSILMGTTFNNCRFNGLETKDGMRRRVSYYVSEKHARINFWPSPVDNDSLSKIKAKLQFILLKSGEMSLSKEARALWDNIQSENRENRADNAGFSVAEVAHLTMLSEAPSKILKRAMIFEMARWANDHGRKWQVIQADTLALAAEHESYCLAASQQLDTIGMRAENRNVADSILAKIRSEYFGSAFVKENWVYLTKTQLTCKFAPNPGRRGEMTPDRLYTVILPDLIKRKLAFLDNKKGKRQVFAFRMDDLEEE